MHYHEWWAKTTTTTTKHCRNYKCLLKSTTIHRILYTMQMIESQGTSLEGGSLSGRGKDHTGRQPGRGFTVRQGKDHTPQEDSLKGGSLSGRGVWGRGGGGPYTTGRQPGRGFTVRQGEGPYRTTAWKRVHCQAGGRTIQEDSL